MSWLTDRIMELDAAAVHILTDDKPPWVGYQEWRDLLFMSWPLPVESLRPKIPAYFDIDTYDGSAWVSLVAMSVHNQHLRDLPPIPGFSRYHQLNLRTYIRNKDLGGVYFFSLDCDNAASGWFANNLFNIPYRRADEQHLLEQGKWHFTSTRTQEGFPPAEFDVVYAPVGEEFLPPAQPLDFFLMNRYFLGVKDGDGHIFQASIFHKHWKVHNAEFDISTNTVAAAEGITLPDTSPQVAFAESVETLLYPQVKVGYEP